MGTYVGYKIKIKPCDTFVEAKLKLIAEQSNDVNRDDWPDWEMLAMPLEEWAEFAKCRRASSLFVGSCDVFDSITTFVDGIFTTEGSVKNIDDEVTKFLKVLPHISDHWTALVSNELMDGQRKDVIINSGNLIQYRRVHVPYVEDNFPFR